MELQMTETLALITALASAVAVAALFLTGGADRRDEPALQPVPVSAERDPAPRRGAPHRED
jgi:hypothetical protein